MTLSQLRRTTQSKLMRQRRKSPFLDLADRHYLTKN